MVNGWKVTAIIFIILDILVVSLFVWGYNIATEEEEMNNECYYNVCEEYPQAYFDAWDKTCTCYSVDYNGDYAVEKVKYLS